MVAMANLNIPERAVRQQIASAINLIVQVTRLSDGTRRVTGITEMTGMEGEVITMQDIFLFERTGMTAEGQVQGRFRATGIRPKCSDRLAVAGVKLGRRHVRAHQAGRLRCRDVDPLVLLSRWSSSPSSPPTGCWSSCPSGTPNVRSNAGCSR